MKKQTTIDGIEYDIKDNAPSPTQYGVEVQIISVLSEKTFTKVESYNYITGEYNTTGYNTSDWLSMNGLHSELNNKAKKDKIISLPNIDKKSAKNSHKVRTYGNIWVKKINLKNKGDVKQGHKHEFDHLHFIASGSAKITVYSDKDTILLEKEYMADSWIKVPKEHFHTIEALEDNTVGYCIQSLLGENNQVVETDYLYDTDFIKEVEEYEKTH